MEDVNTATKMATSVVVMCFLISIGLSILLIGRAFWNQTEYTVDTAAGNVGWADAYSLASKAESVPVASVYRVLQGLNLTVGDVYDTLELHVYDKNGVELYDLDGSGYKIYGYYDGTHYGTTLNFITDNLGERCYFSYYDGRRPDGTEAGGLFYAEVRLCDT